MIWQKSTLHVASDDIIFLGTLIPESNRLGEGLSEDELSEFVAKSGYPLQIAVGRILTRNGLESQQEWTYTDKQDNKELNIDV